MLNMHPIRIAVLLGAFLQSPLAHAWRLEAGQATTNNTSTTPAFNTVAFQNGFDVTPIVVVLPTNQGSDPSTLRIQNITTSGFDVAPVEPTGNDGPHAAMTFHYVAIEPGTHNLPDGTQIAAGVHSTSTFQSKLVGPTGWDTVNFGTTLSANASVVATIQTINSEGGAIPGAPSSPFLTVATRNLSPTTVQMALERSEDNSGTVSAEDIGWIAFPTGNNGSFPDISDNSIGWDARSTADTVRGWDNGCSTHTFTATSWANARVLGTKNRRDGVDGGWTRRCSLSGTSIGLVIDEDRATDTERAHTTESVSLLSFSDSFHAELIGTIAASKDVTLVSGGYALPGSTVRYTINTQSTGNLPIDTDTLVFLDKIPDDVALRVADIGGLGSGPVLFNEGTPASTLSYSFTSLADLTDDVDFSNDDGTTFTYVPTPGGDGADPDVTDIRITPKGSLPFQTGASAPNFSIEFDAVIE